MSFTLPLGFIIKYGGRERIKDTSLTVATGVNRTNREKSIDKWFFSELLNTSFTTIYGAADDGVCRLTHTIKDRTGDFYLTDGDVPLEVMAIPGRVRSSGVAGDPSNTPCTTGFPLNHLFVPGTYIDESYANTGDAATVDRVWIGFEFEPNTFKDSTDFYDKLAAFIAAG